MTPEQRFLADLKKKGLRPFIGGAPFNDGTTPIVPPLLISGSATAANVGDSTPFSPTISGGVPPYALGLAPGSNPLPSGRTIVSNSVVGTYTAAGNFAFILRVTDSAGTTADLAVVQTVAAAAAATRASITSINADGWSAQDSAPIAYDPVGAPQYVVVNRQGFDGTGAPKTYTDNLILTTRVRQPYPNQASPDATGRAALNDYIYATDTIAGGSSATNNSTMTSPQPVVQFVGGRNRAVVGNLIPKEFFEACAFHRNARKGKQIACFVWTITDKNGLALTITATGTVISGNPYDKVPVPVYRPAANVDVSPLAEGQLTVNGRAFPWIGTAGSVADSSTGTVDALGFSPLVFRKAVALAANPPIAYVDAANPAGSPQVSITDATAYANPFPDLGSAEVAMKAFTGNDLAGTIIYMKAGTQVLGTASGGIAFTSVIGEQVIAGDPRTTPDQVIFNITANTSLPADYPHLKNLTYSIPNFNYINPNGTAPLTIENCISAAANAQITSRALRLLGLTNTGSGKSSSAATMLLCRGVAGAYTSGITVNAVVGNSLAPAVLVQAANDNRGVVAFNLITKAASTVIGIDTADISGFALVQNVIETTGTAAGYSLGVSTDGKANNITHFICHNNTFAGAFAQGRANNHYDEKIGTVRTHKLHSFRGNIHVQMNCKSDIFVGANAGNTADAPSHIGNWSYRYGVGSAGEVVCWPDPGGQNGTGTTFGQDYSGLSSLNGPSVSAPIVPRFANPQCVTYNPAGAGSYTAGAGGGNYALQSGSPCASSHPDPVLEFDILGAARKATNDSSGAYMVAA